MECPHSILLILQVTAVTMSDISSLITFISGQSATLKSICQKFSNMADFRSWYFSDITKSRYAVYGNMDYGSHLSQRQIILLMLLLLEAYVVANFRIHPSMELNKTLSNI